MNTGNFDTIAWDNTEAALEGTSKMFKMWYAKQGSGFCEVGYWTSNWEGNENSRCPSCKKLNKRVDHLNQCTNKARTAVFMDQINLIEEWMESTYTYPNLQTWLILYLKKRNKTRFQDLEGIPNSMRSIAEEKDRIGWEHFVEGRMTKGIRDMQTMYMCNSGSVYTEHHWMRDFIRKLMVLTHEQ